MPRLALIQMLVEGGRKETNLRRAEARIAEAAAAGADLLLLPEALTLGWTHRSTRTEADPIPVGEGCTRLQAAAARHRVHVCAGLVEAAGSRHYNAALLISPTGELLLHHRKINELDIGRDLYATGDRLGVAQTPFGSVGVMICADAFVEGQVISRTARPHGGPDHSVAVRLAVPVNHDNGAEPYGRLWLDNYGPVARDVQLWIAGASNVGWITDGSWRGRK